MGKSGTRNLSFILKPKARTSSLVTISYNCKQDEGGYEVQKPVLLIKRP